MTDPLIQQYNAYAYPAPILDLDAYVRNGGRDLSDPATMRRKFWPKPVEPVALRILVAGCGTNQAALLAYSNPDCFVMGVDASLAAVESHVRLKARHHLSNLRVAHLTLSDLDSIAAKEGAFLNDIGAVIQDLAEAEGLSDDPIFQRKLADLEIDLLALEYTELRTLARESSGKGPGPESSLLKIKGTEVQQRLTELMVEAVGAYALPDGWATRSGNLGPVGPVWASRAAPTYFNMRKTSIFGGSNEIQRNIIAKMVLGL